MTSVRVGSKITDHYYGVGCQKPCPLGLYLDHSVVAISLLDFIQKFTS